MSRFRSFPGNIAGQRLLIAAWLAGGLLAACGSPEGTAVYKREFLAFGTLVSIDIRDADRARAARGADAVEAFFHDVDQDWYAFGDGELARANAALERGEAVELTPTLAPLVARAIDYHRRSGGLFDPAMGDLVRLWHFDSEEALATATTPPESAAIATIRAARGGMADLQLEGRLLRSSRPLSIDLGGMAKGTALSRAGEILRGADIQNALVGAGGSSLLALGRSGARAWRVGIRDPRSRRVLGVVELQPGESIDTSGDYERFFVTAGHRYHHILDPRTGYPATATAGVTVIAADAESADAASTALLVGGPQEFDRLRMAFHLRAALLITTTGELVISPAMRQRLLRANGGRLPRLEWHGDG